MLMEPARISSRSFIVSSGKGGGATQCGSRCRHSNGLPVLGAEYRQQAHDRIAPLARFRLAGLRFAEEAGNDDTLVVEQLERRDYIVGCRFLVDEDGIDMIF